MGQDIRQAQPDHQHQDRKERNPSTQRLKTRGGMASPLAIWRASPDTLTLSGLQPLLHWIEPIEVPAFSVPAALGFVREVFVNQVHFGSFSNGFQLPAHEKSAQP